MGDIQIDEDIDNYWAALDAGDRKWSAEEESYARRELGIKILTDDQKRALDASVMTQKRTLQGCHSYDILANPLYFDDFQYVSASVENRENYIIDDDVEEGNDAMQSDLVRIALNLAYMKEEDALNFTFNQSDAAKKAHSRHV